jgi:hypothetical protein
MNVRRRAVLAAVLGLIVCQVATAQIPSPEKLAAALAAEFRTAAAQPPTKHRGPLMRDVEPLLIQQARHLVSELRPWSQDPHAALLPLLRRTPSSESGIRPNAHTAKGLALLVRLVPADAFPADFPPALARERALAMLRYFSAPTAPVAKPATTANRGATNGSPPTGPRSPAKRPGFSGTTSRPPNAGSPRA